MNCYSKIAAIFMLILAPSTTGQNNSDVTLYEDCPKTRSISEDCANAEKCSAVYFLPGSSTSVTKPDTSARPLLDSIATNSRAKDIQRLIIQGFALSGYSRSEEEAKRLAIQRAYNIRDELRLRNVSKPIIFREPVTYSCSTEHAFTRRAEVILKI